MSLFLEQINQSRKIKTNKQKPKKNLWNAKTKKLLSPFQEPNKPKTRIYKNPKNSMECKQQNLIESNTGTKHTKKRKKKKITTLY